MDVKTLYVILAVVIIVIIGVVVFIKTEKYSSGPISFQIIQKNDPLQGIVYNYINLPAGNDIYTVMVDTGSPNLVINSKAASALSFALSTASDFSFHGCK